MWHWHDHLCYRLNHRSWTLAGNRLNALPCRRLWQWGWVVLLTWIHLERLVATGEVTSPNYPDDYPDNLNKTQTIQVESGKLLRLQFTHFEVRYGSSNCQYDFVKITDGDGTTLVNKSCGYYSSSNPGCFQPPKTTITRSNRVEIFFHADSYTSGFWSLRWSAVTPGVKTLMSMVSHFLYYAFIGTVGHNIWWENSRNGSFGPKKDPKTQK